jgi:hypothetical protein
MIIVGVDYHPSVQQVAFLDMETGETGERRLNHSDGEAELFYRDLCPRITCCTRIIFCRSSSPSMATDQAFEARS